MATKQSDLESGGSTSGRTDRLLALLLLESMKNTPDREKAKKLSSIGFSNQETATLLDTTPAVVAQHLYKAREGTAKKKAAARGKSPKKGAKRRNG